MDIARDIDRRVVTLSLARLADAVGNSFLIIVLPLYISSGLIQGGFLGFSELFITGLVLSLFGFVSSSIQRLTGVVSDRIQRRRIFVLLGLLLLSITSFSYSLISSYAGLLFIRALQGLAGGMIIPAGVALVSEFSSTTTRGGSMGVYNTFRLIGFGAGPIAAGAVVQGGPYNINTLAVEINGFEAAFYFAALTAATSFFLVWIFVDDPDYIDEESTSQGLGFKVFSSRPDKVFTTVFTLGLATLFMATCIALFATLQNPVNERLDQGSTLFGLQFAAFIIAQVLFQTPLGRASDKIGRRPFIIWGMALLIPTTIAQGLVLSPVSMFIARFLQGVAGAMVFSPALALVGDISGRETGGNLSILTMGFGFGIAVGPLTSGYLIRYGFLTPFLFGALLALMGTLLVATHIEETIENPSRLGFLP